MKHGYFSKTIANKKWLICPRWNKVSEANSAGKDMCVDVTFVINDIIQNDYIKNFLNYNKLLYPDLEYVGILNEYVTSGVKSSEKLTQISN